MAGTRHARYQSHVERISANLLQAVDVAVRAGEATPRLERPSPQVDHFRAGFLGYVTGTPEDRALVPQLTLSSDIVNMSQLTDLIAGHAQDRTSDKQTSFF